MNRIVKNALSQLVLFSCLFSAASAAPQTALVIGNSNYKSISPLRNPVNDATDIAEKLNLLGFEVIEKYNLNRKQMRQAIREYTRRLKQKGGAGIFFFAGHGAQVKGRNYLIPIDADIESEYEVPDEAIEANLLLGALEEAENPLNIIVLDACRDNPFPSSSRSAAKGLARMESGTGTLIAYSTGPGKVAEDGRNQERNSPYTKHLLKHMTHTGLAIEQVFKRVRVGVEKETEGKQIPWETSSLRGDFYFVPETIKPQKKHYPEPQTVIATPVSEKKHDAAEIRTSILPFSKAFKNNSSNQHSSTHKLTIYTNPGSAQIRIINYKKPYNRGIALAPGDYNVEISNEGYLTKKQWITIDQNDIELQVTLVPF